MTPDCIMFDFGPGKMLLITAPENKEFDSWVLMLPEWEREWTSKGWKIDRKHLIFLVNNLPEWFNHPVWRNDRDDCLLKKAGYVAD
jgi:hypothetical protein